MECGVPQCKHPFPFLTIKVICCMIATKKPSFTIDSIKQSACGSLNEHLTEVKTPGKSKYNNQKCVVDGITFDSQKEGGRWMQLQMLLRANLISDLKRQVAYELNPGGTHSLKYVADFVYKNDRGEEIVEDCKGFRTVIYKKKGALMLKVHGITIKET
jgi:hypothetical protein